MIADLGFRPIVSGRWVTLRKANMKPKNQLFFQPTSQNVGWLFGWLMFFQNKTFTINQPLQPAQNGWPAVFGGQIKISSESCILRKPPFLDFLTEQNFRVHLAATMFQASSSPAVRSEGLPSIVGARAAMIVGALGFWLHADVSASPGFHHGTCW